MSRAGATVLFLRGQKSLHFEKNIFGHGISSRYDMDMLYNCRKFKKDGALMIRGRRQQKKIKYRQRLPQVAVSCYSGSDERCGDSCGWDMIPSGKNVRFRDSGRELYAPDDCKAEAVFGGGRDDTDFSVSRLAVALSDGMGKGEAAARESERAVNSVLPLLKAGMDPEMALQVLNLLWSMSNRKEMFPTMDLALLDPVSRELVVYKTGAAPTVIVRAPRCRPGQQGLAGPVAGSRMKKHLGLVAIQRPAAEQPGRTGACLKGAGKSAACRPELRGQAPACSIPPEQFEIFTAPAAPMGVTEYSEIPSISTLVMPGDLIIMMTDGVADSLRSSSGNTEHEKTDSVCSDTGRSASDAGTDRTEVSLCDYPELDWLRRLLNRIKSRNLQTICDLIIREAALNYGNREKDDMTVVVIRV